MANRTCLALAFFLIFGVVTQAQPRYSVTDLGTLGGGLPVEPDAVNNSGHVVGMSGDASGRQRAFIWTPATGMRDLGTLPGFSGCVARDINTGGDIVGECFLAGGFSTVGRAFFLPAGGTMLDLGSLDVSSASVAFGINDARKAIGTVLTVGGWNAFTWVQGAGMVALPKGNASHAFAADVNASGEVAGFIISNTVDAPALWRQDTLVPLCNCRGAARAINDSSQVVGVFLVGGQLHAFRWTNGVMQNLGALDGSFSIAHGINNIGQVVGETESPRRAFIWENGVMRDLSTLIDPNSGWTLLWASDISDAGHIVGQGIHNGLRRGFLLTPIGLPPTRLQATVGNQRVYLSWSPPPTPVDGYNVQVARFDGAAFVPLGTVNPAAILIQQSSFRVFGFANGEFVENGQLYRFTVTAVKSGTESQPSNFVVARPNEFAATQLTRPTSPVLFLHGFGVHNDASTWDITSDFLSNTLRWQFGGTLVYLLTDDPRTTFPFAQNFVSGADYYTATFGDSLANYATGRSGLLHQADEVGGFLRRLQAGGASRKVSIVAHSMGGMSARSYIADNPPQASTQISNFITYGTPHWGASFSSIVQCASDSSIVQCSDGARDLDFDCTNGRLDYQRSAFFENLRQVRLPATIQYFAIRGHDDSFPHRMFTQGCLSDHWDRVIPIDSADLGAIPASAPVGQQALTTNAVPLLTTDRRHTQQTNDFSAILCAIDLNCFVATVRSPVDIEIAAPDGRSLARDLVEIPGASYMELADHTGHSIATVLIPFPQNGTYMIKVIPKQNAGPTGTYSLEVTRAGVTTIVVQDQMVQNIPTQPHSVPVFSPLAIDIKPGGFPNPINLRSQGKVAVAILSNSSFDAPSQVDTGSLTFGHFGSEASLAFCNPMGEDINSDGLPDQICHFQTGRLGLLANDGHAVLRGRTVEGVPFIATDSVRIIP